MAKNLYLAFIEKIDEVESGYTSLFQPEDYDQHSDIAVNTVI